MVDDDDLLARYAVLKGDVVEFALQPRFSRRFREFLAGSWVPDGVGDEIAIIDRFVQQYRWPDGRTVIDRFLAERPDIVGAEREHLLGWRDVVEGVFEIDRHDRGGVCTCNLVDALGYRLLSNLGPVLFAEIPDGSFLSARVVPLSTDRGTEWVLSGSMQVYSPAERGAALDMAVELALARPDLVLRNPELRDRAVEITAQAHRRFVEYFGADLVVLDVAAAIDHITDYLTPWAGDTGMAATLATEYLAPLRGDIITVGLVSDELGGLAVLGDLGLAVAVFDDPVLARQPRYRQLLKGYLGDDAIGAFPLRRLAERDPVKASTVFRTITGRPYFRWDIDGETLLRTHKPDSFTGDPGMTVLNDTLATQLRARTEPRIK
ncbi:MULTISPECIES: hypothetical protein [unclassified Pseudonocardia]|uniref:hypothetical protein n=1 Tax=unclassified Pseudonocardia TaxID=2619320 RepID=UPI000705FED6|nr:MULTISPECIES: hypothetical protein [unclassified Pseudonocardia]ALL85846.1 hypothetical protein AD017_32370 [Pseudonocardia sp. EC080619-01]